MSHDEDSNGLVVLSENIVQEKENSNTNKKPFTCQVCDMKFTRQDVLNSLERIHTKEKTIYCNKKFTQKSQMWSRMGYIFNYFPFTKVVDFFVCW